MVPYIRILLSFFCIYVFMLLLKIENENTSTKTLPAAVSYTGLGSLELSLYRNLPWLELPLTGSNFHGPKPVGATEVLLYRIGNNKSRNELTVA